VPKKEKKRYLEVILNKGLTFTARVDTVVKKAIRTAAALTKYRRSKAVEKEAARLNRGQPAVLRSSNVNQNDL